MTKHSDYLSDEAMQRLLADLADPTKDDEAVLDRVLREHAQDSRLHFLRGSILAAAKRYHEAREAMSRAIEIEPGLDIARFQLGFLEYTSGEPAAAATTWQPFEGRPDDDALAAFAMGLNSLAADDWEGARTAIERGISHNRENPPLNKDMRLLLATLAEKEREKSAEPAAEPVSAVEQFLRQAAIKPTKH